MGNLKYANVELPEEKLILELWQLAKKCTEVKSDMGGVWLIGRALAWLVQSPGFNPQHWKKNEKEIIQE
jgi:hypothetical protein